MGFRENLNWRLKNLLKISAPVFKFRIKSAYSLLKKMPKAASDRYGYLSLRYNTHTWFKVCNKKEFLESLYLLDLLDSYLPRRQYEGPGLDIGSKSWSYLPGLAAYTGNAWVGIEVDPYQRYLDMSTRYGRAKRMLKAYPDSKYICGSLLEDSGRYKIITWILPFMEKGSLLKWGLPEQFFQPEELLQHAISLLDNDGVLFIINQNETDMLQQKILLDKLKIKSKFIGELNSNFSPFKRRRYGWLISANEQ
jgi:hypothetical protein